MNYRSLVWYSSLAIGEEKNNFVARFLKQSCELLNEEINEEIKRKKLPFNFGIDFLHVQRGEDGLNQLSNKFNEINDPIFTNGHSINKYNPLIIDKIKDKSFFLIRLKYLFNRSLQYYERFVLFCPMTN